MKNFLRNISVLHLITVVLAFCSIVYELILAQALSAFLENTVLRYSVTIGLYMFSLGVGSFMAEGRVVRRSVLNLLRVEIVLTVVGGFSVPLLFLLDWIGLPRLAFSMMAHFLIIAIGILSGFEIPLLMDIRSKERGHSENEILGTNYAGAFAGTIVFAFVFYPRLGLLPSAFFIGFLNAMAGLLLATQKGRVDKPDTPKFYLHLYTQMLMFVVIGFCLMFSDPINEFFLNLYLS